MATGSLHRKVVEVQMHDCLDVWTDRQTHYSTLLPYWAKYKKNLIVRSEC